MVLNINQNLHFLKTLKIIVFLNLKRFFNVNGAMSLQW
jgi:hypothetical protein